MIKLTKISKELFSNIDEYIKEMFYKKLAISVFLLFLDIILLFWIRNFQLFAICFVCILCFLIWNGKYVYDDISGNLKKVTGVIVDINDTKINVMKFNIFDKRSVVFQVDDLFYHINLPGNVAVNKGDAITVYFEKNSCVINHDNVTLTDLVLYKLKKNYNNML